MSRGSISRASLHEITSSPDDFYGLVVDDVARGLAAAVNGDLFAGFDATAVGDSLTLSITLPLSMDPADPAAAEYAAFTLTAGDGVTVNSVTQSPNHFGKIDLALSGTPAVGETWSLELNGTTYGYNVESGDDLSAVALGLASAVSSQFVVGLPAGGTTLTISAADGSAFTAAFAISEAGTLGAGAVSTVTAAYIAAAVQVTGAVAGGAQWSVTIDGRAYFYAGGENGESTDVGFVDVQILDDDTAGVIVVQSGGSTDVTEPTDQVTMGSGQVISVTAGDSFVGTFGTAVISGD